MDAKVIVELLEPLIGRDGTATVKHRAGMVQVSNPKHPVSAVEARSDGMILIANSDGGWAVLDPARVEGVMWDPKDGESAGTYL